MPAENKLSPETLTNLKRPKMYYVILHNDDYTTMEFVTELLIKVFNKPSADAANIMMSVHKSGSGIAGKYTYDIAVTKKLISDNLSEEHGFPLKITIDEAIE